MRAPLRPFVLAISALLLLGAASFAHAARFDLPVRHAGESVAAPALLGDQFVVRLRREVAYTAWAQLEPRPVSSAMRAERLPALTALAARLGGVRMEPEFAGLTPAEWGSELASFWIVHVPPGGRLETTLPLAESSPEVAEAFPMTIEPLEDTAALGRAYPGASGGGLDVAAPNDSLWSISWYLRQNSRRDIHVLEAWDVTTGDDSTVIAILDTGVLSWHPDLGGTVAGEPGRMFVNRAERDGTPNFDDDHNGFVDDVSGWDFVDLDSASLARPGEDWGDPDNDPSDFAIHGTAVSGVAAAIANNVIGITGVAPGARIMPLRCGYSAPFNATGEIVPVWAARAMVYAAKNGASVINISFSGTPNPDIIAAANYVQYARVPLVVSAGNNGSPHYLADRDETIAVGATDSNDKVLNFSNRGPYVDLCAPGNGIAVLTLKQTAPDSIGLRTPSYSSSEAGTSFSAPMVAAAVTMLQAQRRLQGRTPLHPYAIQLRIKETTDDISSVNTGNDYGTGRLNLQRMLTDPPRSVAFDAPIPTVGAGVPIPTQTGRGRMAHVFADGTLRILDAVTGDEQVRVVLGAPPTGGIAAADFGAGIGTALVVGLEDGRLAAYDLGGHLLPGWPVDATTTRGLSEAMPSLGDLDGDGIPEIVWGGDDGAVWAWHVDGRRVTGFPRHVGISGVNLRVALGNITGDARLEIVVATSNFAMFALNGDGSPVPIYWPVYVGDRPTAPVIARLKSTDAWPSIIVAAGFGLRAYDATGLLRWVTALPSTVSQELAVGDLDGNGSNEVVIASTGPDVVTVVDSVGNMSTLRQPTTLIAGPPYIGPVLPGRNAQIVIPMRDNTGKIRLNAWAGTTGLPDVRGWPKAGHPGNALSMGDVDGDGATELLAGAGIDSLNYVYDAGAGTWRVSTNFWPTTRGDLARTGGRTNTGLPPADDLSPDAVDDLAAAAGVHDAALNWTAPADPGTALPLYRYEVRWSTSPITGANFALATLAAPPPTPAAPGTAEQMTLAGLPEDRALWFAVRGQDPSGNWSDISNVAQAHTGAEPPASVADLRFVAGNDTSLTVAWTATADDGSDGNPPALYRVRWSPAPMDSAGFANAPNGFDVAATAPPGATESVVIGGLEHGRRYWFAMRVVDAAGHVSPISNQIALVVGRLAGMPGVALLPARSPSTVPVRIEWQGAPEFSGGPQFIQIFDLTGRRLNTLPLTGPSGGIAAWDGRDGSGAALEPGVYFARLTSGPFHARTRIVLIR